MIQYFAYVRVSTPRQGTEGVSLLAQREAILAYAQHHRLVIAAWFEERQTAARQGRPMFNNMLQLLTKGGVRGIIIHKIDRGARNLRDWASLGELIDQGIDVRFAGDNLDLHSRGGRLAADIQAVVAADFIRNLREETRKGVIARLRQGIWPFRAPVGYFDNGRGRPKLLDLVRAPRIREAFELYATGNYSLTALAKMLNGRGFRNLIGNPVDCEYLSYMFRNQFYAGILRYEKGGDTYQGIHEALVPMPLFMQVQQVLRRKTHRAVFGQKHQFTLTFRCCACVRYMIAERHKGHTYYRCHTPGCTPHALREKFLRDTVRQYLCALGRTKEASTIAGASFWTTQEILADLTGEIKLPNGLFRFAVRLRR